MQGMCTQHTPVKCGVGYETLKVDTVFIALSTEDDGF